MYYIHCLLLNTLVVYCTKLLQDKSRWYYICYLYTQVHFSFIYCFSIYLHFTVYIPICICCLYFTVYMLCWPVCNPICPGLLHFIYSLPLYCACILKLPGRQYGGVCNNNKWFAGTIAWLSQRPQLVSYASWLCCCVQHICVPGLGW